MEVIILQLFILYFGDDTKQHLVVRLQFYILEILDNCFLAIPLRLILTCSGSTCSGLIYRSNIYVFEKKERKKDRNI